MGSNNPPMVAKSINVLCASDWSNGNHPPENAPAPWPIIGEWRKAIMPLVARVILPPPSSASSIIASKNMGNWPKYIENINKSEGSRINQPIVFRTFPPWIKITEKARINKPIISPPKKASENALTASMKTNMKGIKASLKLSFNNNSPIPTKEYNDVWFGFFETPLHLLPYTSCVLIEKKFPLSIK